MCDFEDGHCCGECYRDKDADECDCGSGFIASWTCPNCNHIGCKDCMFYDKDYGEWFCDDDCQEEYLKQKL